MRVHVFVDAENISAELFIKGYKQLRAKYSVAQLEVFSKLENLPSMYKRYKKAKFVECFYGKNSADTFMTAHIVRAVYEEPLIDMFVVFTHDKDLAPAIKAVTDCKKRVMLITEQDRYIPTLDMIGTDMTYFEHKIIPVHRKEHLETIFVKNGNGDIYEVPFANGMEIHDFKQRLPLRQLKKGFPKSTNLTEILRKSLVTCKDNAVYLEV